MTRKTSYEGERFGNWYVESKAPAQGGKRFWNVTNTVTDAKMVVAQTELKNLAKGDDAVPNSWEITANVLAGNHADNPFAVPAAAFEPRFLEPCVADDNCAIVEGRHIIDNPFGETVMSGEDIEIEGAEEFVEDWVAPRDGGLSMAMPAGVPADESDLRIAIREAMMQISDMQHTLDKILKAAINL